MRECGVRECGSGFRARPRLLLAALVPLVLGGCGTGCADEVVQHEPSPYGPGTAIVFVRDCGVTDPTAQVAIVGHGGAGGRERNVVFVGDAYRAPAEGGADVRVRWIAAGHVEIAHDPRSRVSTRAESHGGIRITYTALLR